MQTQGVYPGADQSQPYENNHLHNSAGRLGRHCGRFCGCGFLKKPSDPTTTACNLLILRDEFWVEYLVPNPIPQVIENYGILWFLSDCC